MATIENMNQMSHAERLALLRSMSDQVLFGQQIVQQGAIHAISALLTLGCSEAIATEMLASSRMFAGHIRNELARRGLASIFDVDQTSLSSDGVH